MHESQKKYGNKIIVNINLYLTDDLDNLLRRADARER